MSKDRDIVALAALLHDIGKFYQRVDDAGAKRSNHLQTEIKRLEEMYCPLINQSWRGYKHVIWTAQFLADHETYFKQLLLDDYPRFFKATVSHHRPDPADAWQLLVQQADHFSAGADRTQQKGTEDAQAERGWDQFKNVRMTSIFQSIGSPPLENRLRLPISSMRLAEDYFPQDSFTAPGQPEYALLWHEFSTAFQAIKANTNSVSSLIENLLALFAKYLVNVPSSTQHLPDVSLYDHLKSTAAMATCLYDFWVEKGRGTNLRLDAEEAPILLIGGDLSGIQQYIYDIIAKNAAKNLKGRSFYLYLLVDNIVRSLLQELSLPSSAVLYQSGGGFYLLAPNTSFIRSTLTTFRRRIESLLFQEHKTQLFLGLAAIPVTTGMVFKQEIGQAWQAIMQAIAKTKRQKHKVELVDDYQAFFSPQEIGGKQQRDAISGEEFTKEESKAILTVQQSKSVVELEDGFVKRSTFDQIELGKKLRDTQWWIVSPHRIRAWDKFSFEFCGLGLFNYLFSEKELQQAISVFCPDEVTVISFDPARLSAGPNLVRGNNNTFQFQFYGGNDHPRDPQGNPITYDQLAQAGSGAQKLGILRMDIDNLGALFATGLGTTDRTFSKYSTLSRNLDYFFKGYLNKIWQMEDFCQTTSIVYAGGDDLFIVGFWSSLIDMAQRIRESFAAWTCHNPALTLSGGLAVVPGKFPISKAAEMAEVAEKQAKAHYYDGQMAKNAFTFLHKPLRWEEELASVQGLKEQMVHYVKTAQLPRGFLQKMIRYAQLADHQTTHQLNPSWRWHMAYDFARALGRTKDEEAKAFYTQLQLSAYRGQWEPGSSYTYLQILEIAARWAELETKI